MARGGEPAPRVLMVATKCPWPPTDGGRLVLAETLRALTDAGVEITLVSPPEAHRRSEEVETTASATAAPMDAALRRVAVARRVAPWILTVLRPSTPATIVRQTDRGTTATIARLVAEERFDVAHAEQLHALPMLEPARRRGIPVVLRAQNVESDLWSGAARAMPVAAPWLRLQAALLRRFEGRAVALAAVTAALTAPDAERLRALAILAAAGGTRQSPRSVIHIPAPFPAVLPQRGERLPGEPVLALAAGGWIPNRDGARWFVREVWPLVRADLPAARFHVFGAPGGLRMPEGATAHPTPADSIDLFPAGAIHLVPLRVASGVRMKILESWARGAPVVATVAAAAGLEAGADAALLKGSTPRELADAIGALARDAALAHRLIESGHVLLARSHDPAAIAARWLELYGELAAAHGANSPEPSRPRI